MIPLERPRVLSAADVRVDVQHRDDGWSWSISTDGPVAVRSVAIALDAGPAGPDPRVFRHGYQSWSPSSVARLGVDRDPSAAPGVPSLVRGMHHADPVPVDDPMTLRSELVTVLRTGAGTSLLGFAGGADHDGTFRVRILDGRVEMVVEAFLGDAIVDGTFALHDVVIAHGDEPAELLEAWSSRAGRAGDARVHAPYQVGWCSWYHWFHDISEAELRRSLALASDWPFDVFQLDDGYQAAIGDWLQTNERFPTPIDGVAAAIRDAGRTPGLWLAPFLAAPGSRVATEHPDWLARHQPSGEPLVGMVNDGWGGVVWTLDTTNPDVLAHLERTAAALVEAGYPYLKLDFTYAPSLPGAFSDPARTPAQRVRAGVDAVRRGAGDGTFLLGCGLPLGAGIGVVDGMRIGPDVAPWWDRPPGGSGGRYDGAEPATANAFRNTLTRSFQHRRLWLNDPDCLMLRTSKTSLTADEAARWARTVGASGGMALVSDDLALLDARARALLDEVVETGRAADERSRAGSPPRCAGLLDADPPVTFES